MELTQWNESINIGHEQIDAEHRRLVELIVELQASLKEGIVNPHVGVALKGLVEFTQTHFATEQAEMLRTQYPEYHAHAAKHDEFTKQVVRLLRDLKAGDSVNAIQLITLAQHWLSDHIMTFDKKLGLYLKEYDKLTATAS